MSRAWTKTLSSAAIAVLIAVLAAGARPAAIGQEGEGALEIDEIIVTSQRREQSVQEIPLAVTALEPEQMELKQIANVADLQYQVPNISIAANSGTANGARIFLRGVGEEESRASADPAVGIYVDGIYIGRQVGALFDLVDLQRIEVLRGPQGTLYGRNSNGGAIKLISKAPRFDANALDFKVGAGSQRRLDAKITANLALSESTAIRATLLSKNRDGFHTLNPNGDFASSAGANVGEIDTRALRLAIAHNFSAAWSARLTLDATDDESDPAPDSAAPPNDADNNLFTIEPLPGAVCSASTPPNFQPIGCFTAYSSAVETSGATLGVSGDVGDYTLAFLSGYRQMEDDLASRIGFPYAQQTDQEQLSQEVTLTSNFAGRFNFVAGVYYFSEDVQLNSVFIFPFELGVETDAYAVFFQSTYDVNDTLTLTTGARYTDESKSLDARALQSGAARLESVDFTNATWTVSLNNRFNENLMGYVSYSTGFKSGGWSPDCFSPAACFLPVNEEELDSFEIGIRSDLIEQRLRLNLTYFYNRYGNLQIASTVPGLGFTRFNVNETEISGLEAELVLRATENLAFNATLGTIAAEYKSLNLDQAGGLSNAGSSPGCAGVVTIACARELDLKNAPEFKGTIGVVHRAALGGGVLTTGVDLAFEDESWSLVANAPRHARVDVDTLINARIAFAPDKGQWQVALWGKNLSDEAFARAAAAASFSQYAAEPLTWGLDFGYRF